MVQGRDETVPQFAHRFLEVQHSLEKLIPNIHYTPDQQDTELQHAFLIKLRPPIPKHLVSRDFDFTSLQSVIDVAERYDSKFPSSVPNNRAMYADSFREDKAMLKFPSGTSNTSPPKCFSCGKIRHLKKDCKSTPLGRSNSFSNARNGTKKKSDVCYFYYRYSKPKCLIQSDGLFKCKFGKLHKCSLCTRFGCAFYQHNSDAQLKLLNTPDMSEINHQITSTINEGFDKLASKLAGLTSPPLTVSPVFQVLKMKICQCLVCPQLYRTQLTYPIYQTGTSCGAKLSPGDRYFTALR